MATGNDYYSVLGVSASASADEIKKQYRRLAKQYHPDTNPDNPKASERFKEISEAYGVLGDKEKRAQYDEMRRLGAFGSGGARGGPGGFPGGFSGGFPGGFPGGGRGRGARGSTKNGGAFEFDVGGLGGLGDLFGSMFGGGSRSRGPEAGETVERTIDVPFRTAVTGGKLPVDLEVTEECVVCRGTGGAPGATMRECDACDGQGSVSFAQGGFAVNRPCPSCAGRGQIPSERCGACGGAGVARTKRRVLITVPVGAESGTKLRLRGQGGRCACIKCDESSGHHQKGRSCACAGGAGLSGWRSGKTGFDARHCVEVGVQCLLMGHVVPCAPIAALQLTDLYAGEACFPCNIERRDMQICAQFA
jgi:molecular chaperone DnaJ